MCKHSKYNTCAECASQLYKREMARRNISFPVVHAPNARVFCNTRDSLNFSQVHGAELSRAMNSYSNEWRFGRM